MIDLHEKALKLAREYKRVESELIDVLQRIDEQKTFRALDYASLFEYSTKALGLSESVSYALISVSRKSRRIPELKTAIDNGLSLSRAKVMTAVLTKENATELIEKAKDMTHREFEKEVARINPKPLSSERTRYMTENRVELRMSLSEEALTKLRRIQDLESQRTSTAQNLENTLEAMMDFYLEKKDPVKRADRILQEPSARKVDQCSSGRQGLNNGKSNNSTSSNRVSGIRRAAIPSQIKHQINQRDRGKCTFIDVSGKKCDNQRWIEIHHKVPVSIGEENSLSNLITLCNSHHKMLHSSGVLTTLKVFYFCADLSTGHGGRDRRIST